MKQTHDLKSFALTSAVNKSQQHRNKFPGMLRIEPRTTWWEARMLHLCYAWKVILSQDLLKPSYFTIVIFPSIIFLCDTKQIL